MILITKGEITIISQEEGQHAKLVLDSANHSVQFEGDRYLMVHTLSAIMRKIASMPDNPNPPNP